MSLDQHFAASGMWLFRWRSFVPLIPVVVMLLASGKWGDFLALAPGMQVALFTTAAFTSALGLAVRVAAVGCTPKGTSGRNTRGQVAETLNTTGVYSVVRHPLYLGNFLMGLGVSFLTVTWWLPTLYSLFFWLYYERIMFAEERFLAEKFGSAFSEWAGRTRAFVPAWSGYTAPALPFSLRNVLRREYNGAYALCVLFLVFHAVHVVRSAGVLRLEPTQRWVWAAATVVWLLLRHLKRRTRLLEVAGR